MAPGMASNHKQIGVQVTPEERPGTGRRSNPRQSVRPPAQSSPFVSDRVEGSNFSDAGDAAEGGGGFFFIACSLFQL